MGLGGFNSGSNATFLRIGMGKDDKGNDRAVIAKRAKEGDPGAVPVMFKDDPVLDADGKQIYRTEHLYIEGMVTAIERADPEFNGKKVSVLNIRVEDGADAYSLQVQRGDDYWLDFALRCDNADWSKRVRITPYSIPQEENPKYSNKFLVLSSDGVKAERKYKVKWMREVSADFVQDPNQPPPFTYDADEGEWRKGKTLRWLDEGPVQRAIDRVLFLNEQPVEKTALDAAAEHAQRNAAAAEAPAVMEEDDDDLPF